MVPMEVNRARARSDHMVVCHCCCRTGNYASECFWAYDLWTMTMEEKLELPPELLGLADSSDVPHIKRKPEVVGGLRPKEEMPDDFGSSSG